ncbi:MAG: restriction endonuclease subunit S [Candidatus Bathyarchaeia archaeon]|jgi:hypothetical protein
METTHLENIFRIVHGNKFDLNKMKLAGSNKEAIAFVGRSSEKNGIVAHVEKYKDIEPFPTGFITVALGGSTLSSFVQPRPFYTAQNIDVLEPLSEMSLDVKLYYCLCVEANRFRYSTFGREANRTLRILDVPKRESVPKWVEGAAKKSLEELKLDLTSML